MLMGVVLLRLERREIPFDKKEKKLTSVQAEENVRELPSQPLSDLTQMGKKV